jgi:nicotinamide-nucleotide amidase
MSFAEIVAIGSELLSPDKVDTNGPWLTGRLSELGIVVRTRTLVGDDVAIVSEAVGDALRRSDLVITTGGLGPTEDDVTREATARALDRNLIYHDDIEAHLSERFRAWGREMPEINKRQAWVIDGAVILPNPNGSAVGMLVETDAKALAVLPGPPRENQPMFDQHVLPRLDRFRGDGVTRRRVLRVSGMGESAVDELAAPIYKGFSAIETSILFNRSEVEIHLLAREATAKAADEQLANLTGRLTDAFGAALFSTNGESMEEVVGRLLIERGETLALAESCTGGLIGERITNVAGSSEYFLEGAVTYSNQAKTRMLGVPAELIESHGAVSAECAEAMASGARQLSGADHAVSVTGIAGPGGGSAEKPVGLVFIGYAGPEDVRSLKLVLPGDRYLIRWRASQAALDYLRRQLLKQ